MSDRELQISPLGIGLSYRTAFKEPLFAGELPVDHLELAIERSFYNGELAFAVSKLIEQYPVILHGVSQSPGSVDYPSRARSTETTKQLVTLVDPLWVGEHLSFSGTKDYDGMQLMPVRKTEEAAKVAAANARRYALETQRPVLLEYIACPCDVGGEYTDGEFVSRVLELSGCGLLLDLHNVYANALNRDRDPFELLTSLPLEKSVQLHLAGGQWSGSVYTDSHDAPIPEDVWKLYTFLLEHVKPFSVIIERDSNYPDPKEIADEIVRAKELLAGASGTLAIVSTEPERTLLESASSIECSEQVDLVTSMKRAESGKQTNDLAADLASRRKRKFVNQMNSVFLKSTKHFRTYIEDHLHELVQKTDRAITPLEKAEAIEEELREAMPKELQWMIDLDLAVARLAFGTEAEKKSEVQVSTKQSVRFARLPDGQIQAREVRRV